MRIKKVVKHVDIRDLSVNALDKLREDPNVRLERKIGSATLTIITTVTKCELAR